VPKSSGITAQITAGTSAQIRRNTQVEAEKAAEPFPTADLSNAVRGLGGRDQVIVESLMVPFLMIVIRVLEDRTPQMWS
jgi:hypothetical protein